MLRPTPGDPRGAEQHHWNTGAKENQQLNPVQDCWNYLSLTRLLEIFVVSCQLKLTVRSSNLNELLISPADYELYLVIFVLWIQLDSDTFIQL